MRRLLPPLTLGLLAAALLAPAATARPHVALRYLGTNPRLGRVVDRPPRNESRGDVIDFRYTLRTPRGVVGTALFHFRYTSRRRVAGSVRLRFREGTVLARGVFDLDARRRVRFRVTGGTRAFRGSRGVILVSDAAGDRIRLTVRLR